GAAPFLGPQPHGDGGHQHQEKPRMPEEESRQVRLAAIEEAGDQERHTGRQRQEDDEEYGRHRGGEIGRKFAAKHEERRAHFQFSEPWIVMWRNTSSSVARST